MDFSHRPGALHQQNKGRKGRASKRATKKNRGGRIDSHGRTGVKGGFGESKEQRKHAARIHMQAKRHEAQQARRELRSGPPRVVGFVALVEGASVDAAASIFLEADTLASSQPMTAGSPVNVTVKAGRPTNLTLAVAPREIHAILDLAKIVDVLVIVHCAGEDLAEWDEEMLSAVRAQGTPTVAGLLQNVNAAIPSKLRGGVRKDFLKFVRKNFPDKDEPKSFDADVVADRRNFVRHVCGLKPRKILWRTRHPAMLVDQMHYEPVDSSLRVSGFLRGRHLNPAQLVHIVGCGTYQIRQVVLSNSPLSKAAAAAGKAEAAAREAAAAVAAGAGSAPMEQIDIPTLHGVGDVLTLAVPPEQRTDLAMENEVDEMAGEQTWPTEEELAAADRARGEEDEQQGGGEGGTGTGKRLPKGTSDYQAAWLVGDEDDDEDSDDAVSDAPGDDNAASEEEMHAVQDDDGDDDEMGGMEAAMQAINFDDVEAERERRRQEEEADSFEFPDEIDTPLETPARVRFARYRGLKSFRSSHWDPKESLPLDYAKIFELESYAMARDRVIAEPACGQVAQPGQYITVVLEGVDVEAATALQARVVRPTGTPDPIVAVGLLPHENQMSVMHVLVQRFDEYEAPVKSKEPMVAHVGFRRFCARPIFSDHNINSDKSKMQRYMQHGFVVATIYAPITFAPNCPALLFTPAGGAVSPLRDARSVDMVAMGSLLSVDPNRIVLKRTILSGFPYKIHKTRAVVRYMFFNAGDIEWFKPIELQTKLGRTGHIRQSIGTHGYMKCQFNGQLRGNDTICLHLYKRQFPPAWDTEWFS